jgi:hypothetical protein
VGDIGTDIGHTGAGIIGTGMPIGGIPYAGGSRYHDSPDGSTYIMCWGMYMGICACGWP